MRLIITIVIFFLCVGTSDVFSLTSGPQQPENQQFVPYGTSDMVDLFTGDFTYNIPLFELPGPNGSYPFNLSYRSGITMDQEATWVGLGWNVTPGAINRTMRGLPDEFNGEDKISVISDMKSNWRLGINVQAGLDWEILGVRMGGITKNLGVYYDSYKGMGISSGLNMDLSLDLTSSLSANLGLSITDDNQEGKTTTPSLGITKEISENKHQSMGLNISANFNSNVGLQSVSLGKSISDYSNSGSFNIGQVTYTPTVQKSFIGSDVNLTLKLGTDKVGLFSDIPISGNFSIHKLKNKLEPVEYSGYGFMNLHQNPTSDNFMMDFNRDNDNSLSAKSPNLPNAYATYDIYSISGQGLSGEMRLYRSDVGILKDDPVESDNYSGAFAFEWGLGEISNHLGVSIGYGMGSEESSSWTSSNPDAIVNKADFKYPYDEFPTNKTLQRKDEPYYFKIQGDNGPENPSSLSNYILDYSPGYAKIYDNGRETSLGTGFIHKTYLDDIPNPNYQYSERDNRTKSVVYFRFDELVKMPKIYNYELYIDNSGKAEINQFKKEHHIAAFEIKAENGMRYIYALPAYNSEHIECSFSTTETDKDAFSTDIYHTSTNQYPDHSVGTETLERKSIPPYVYSYLLTAIVGPDYVDVKNDGPTDDDFGYWVKFAYNSKGDYHWRAPYTGANFIRNEYSKNSDDLGSYMYGIRYTYYLDEASTATHSAKFTLNENRNDGKEASENEFTNDYNPSSDVKSYSLNKIELFSKNNTSIPIKTVHFGYDNSLCKNVPNAIGNEGKLTLKSLYFTYEKNLRGADNKYNFTYSTINPNYNNSNYDRWGHYQSFVPNDIGNLNFPYTYQNKQKADENASAWSLIKISLPTGAQIQVDYESDDYAFVQNLPATEMVQISSANTEQLGPNLFAYKIYFQHDATCTTQEQLRRYLPPADEKGNRQLYFRIFTNLRNKGGTNYEYVTGYLDIDKIDPIGFENNMAYIKVINITLGKKDHLNNHPLQKSAWNYMQMNRPDLVGDEFNDPLGDKELSGKEKMGILTKMAVSLLSFPVIGQNFLTEANTHNYGSLIDIDYTKSFIKLGVLDGVKLGGGSRVKKITIKEDPLNNDVQLGQVYEYTTSDPAYPNLIISSGVATNEPFIGGDETVLRSAKKWSQNIGLRTSQFSFFELPYCYSLFPSASIGYSKVTVKSIASDNVANSPTDPDTKYKFTTGKNINEFYTYKDFPTIVDCSPLQRTSINGIDYGSKTLIEYNPPAISRLLGVNKSFSLGATQGYYIENNDMHGKQKRIENFAQTSTGSFESEPFSSMEYIYNLGPQKIANGRLANTLNSAIHTIAYYGDNIVKDKIYGVEAEHYIDARHSISESFHVNVDVNHNVYTIPVPADIITVFMSSTYYYMNTATIVSTKIVNRSGILQKIIATQDGAVVETHNKLYDATTGSVVLSSLNNEFGENLYNYNIPAHMVYENMGAAYQNENLILQGKIKYNANEKNIKEYTFLLQSNTDEMNRLFQGDEIEIYTIDNENKRKILSIAVITKFMNASAFCFDMVTSNVIPISSTENYFIRIIRSGRRNILNASAGNYTTLKIPPIPTSKVPESCNPNE